MELRVLKLGTECIDKATQLKGTLTHWIVDMGERVDYLFQPEGLNEEGQPLKRLFICLERLKVKEDDFEIVEVPFQILGTQVKNKASGFSGMAISFIRHINGCFHVTIQPSGRLKVKNTPIEPVDFDLRGCTGKAITQLSADEKKKSEEQNPSPTSDTFDRGSIVKPESSLPTRRFGA